MSTPEDAGSETVSDATRAAVVTGAGRGIGRAIALRLAAGGRHVVAVARTAAEVEDTAAVGEGRVVPLVADVADDATAARAVALAEERGRLDVLVNNAAIVDRRPFADLDAVSWDRVVGVNLRGAYLCTRAAFARMAASGGGVIVNIGSLSGVPNVEKFPGLAAYNVSKAGIAALGEAVAVEGRAVGVRCVTLSPGAVDTGMLRRAAPHLRPGVTPEDVAAIVEFLVSDAARPLSGSNIPIFSNA